MNYNISAKDDGKLTTFDWVVAKHSLKQYHGVQMNEVDMQRTPICR